MIHVKVWTSTACVTDMTHAGKVGKTCDTLRISGVPWGPSSLETPAQVQAREVSYSVLYAIESLGDGTRYAGAFLPLDFAPVRDRILALVAEARAAGVSETNLGAHAETCKGIDAPRVPLTAGVPGKWSAGADEKGLSLRQHDDVNEWSEITHKQTGARAYAIAAKVWPHVQAAKTMSEATEILRAAGASLHGYCGMD